MIGTAQKGTSQEPSSKKEKLQYAKNKFQNTIHIVTVIVPPFNIAGWKINKLHIPTAAANYTKMSHISPHI